MLIKSGSYRGLIKNVSLIAWHNFFVEISNLDVIFLAYIELIPWPTAQQTIGFCVALRRAAHSSNNLCVSF